MRSQNFDSLSLNDKRKVQLESRVLVQLDSIDDIFLDTILESDLPLALYLSSSLRKNKELINASSPEKVAVVISNKRDSIFVEEFGDSTLLVFDRHVDSLHLTNSLLINDELRFNKENELGLLTLQPKLNVQDSTVVNLWSRSGKLPNFIYANNENYKDVLSLVAKLNDIPKIFGVVRTEGELLNEVSFENYRDRNVNGYFIFPLEGEGIIPHKAGYYFSPDIIIPTAENKENLKEFIGYPLESDYRLEYHFTFGKTVSNNVVDGNNEFLSNKVTSIKDADRGAVGYFTERAYIDTGLPGKMALKSNFTITAWIKPTQLDEANGILGKGFNFVVKIHQGHLTFTSAGIKDYKSLSSPIPVNEWTHIGLVHSSVNNDLTFYINGKQTDKIKMISEYENSEYNLLVGNNVWEEFFEGYLTDIKIWERELNADELSAEFYLEERYFDRNSLILLLSLIVLIIVLIVVFKYAKTLGDRKRKVRITKVDKKMKLDFKPEEFEEFVLCFGTLRILDKEGVDVANKFSPMMKKLFVIIFLYSQKSGEGISTKKLTEFIWPGMDAKRAKNTRGTTVQNVRAVLSNCSEVDLIFKDKLWSVQLGGRTYCDYTEVRAILDYIKESNYAVDILEDRLPRLLNILDNGRFLSNSSEPWLDVFIEKFSIEIIEQSFLYMDNLNLEKHHELLYAISEVIYLYDDLNEKALQIKLDVLMFQGKLSLARNVYDSFVKLYNTIYKEDYSIDFDQLVIKK